VSLRFSPFPCLSCLFRAWKCGHGSPSLRRRGLSLAILGKIHQPFVMMGERNEPQGGLQWLLEACEGAVRCFRCGH
jgi:hypothetical protein